jgi:hypothetical protein
MDFAQGYLRLPGGRRHWSHLSFILVSARGVFAADVSAETTLNLIISSYENRANQE